MIRRLHTEKAARFAISALALVVLPIAGSAVGGLVDAGAVAGAITGTVFRDYNANGTQDSGEPGVGGVTVTVYDPAGAPLSVTSAANGSYAISSLPTGNRYRLEFTGLPSFLTSSSQSTTAGSSVQFVAEGAVANYAVSNPAEYCQANPAVAITCFTAGIPSGNSNPSIYSIPYSGGAPTAISTATQSGPAYALAYQRSTKRLFSTNMVKRHVGNYENPIGTPLLGQIFSTNPATQVTTPFVDLEVLGVVVKDATLLNNGARGLSTPTAPTIDADPFAKVHKYGLLDLAISEADDTLFVVNGKDSNIYKVALPVGGGAPVATDVTNIGRPPQSCVNGQFRPGALDVKDGLLYVGFVCTAEAAAGTAADLTAQVWTYAITGTPGWSLTPALGPVPLSYTKGCAEVAQARGCAWNPWRDTWNEANVYDGTIVGPDKYTTNPQPFFSDIAFADDGSMIIGLRDRFGDLTGRNQPAPIAGDTRLISGVPSGDILKACAPLSAGGSFSIEGSPGCTRSGSEFYVNDSFSAPTGAGGATVLFHDETLYGGILTKPGSGTVLSTGLNSINNDVARFFTSGLRTFNTADGTVAEARQIIGDSADRFGKGNGLGLLELMCDQAPLEIGNRVWEDTDLDGIQDANEAGIGGVTVRLLSSTNAPIASVVTDASGNYIFSSAVSGSLGSAAAYGLTSLTPNTGYTVAIDKTQSALTNRTISPADSAAVLPDASQDDSDNDFTIAAVANDAIKALTTGGPGANHTYDAGFGPVVTPPSPTCVSVGNYVWFDNNSNGVSDSGDGGAGGVTVRLLDGTTGNVISTTTTNAQGYYLFSCVAPGSYRIQLVTPSGYTSTGPNGASGTDSIADPATSASDNDDNGRNAANGTIESLVFSVSGTNNPLGEPATPGLPDAVPDNRSNVTVDFGLALIPVAIQPTTTTTVPVIVATTTSTVPVAPTSTIAPVSTVPTPTTTKPPTPTTGTGSVCSEIFVDTNQDGIRNPGEPALPGVTVQIIGPNGLVKTATTNAKGTYCFEGLPDGEYQLSVIDGVPGQYSYLTEQSVTLRVLGASAERPTAVFRVSPLALTGSSSGRSVGMGMGLLLAGLVVRGAARPKGRHVARRR